MDERGVLIFSEQLRAFLKKGPAEKVVEVEKLLLAAVKKPFCFSIPPSTTTGTNPCSR
jgi:hypothetical protein